MAKSNKPIVWLPFAAGGTVAAFVLPVLILLTGIAVPLGLLGPETLSYDRLHGFAGSILGKLILLAALLPPLWHGAHRFRMTVQDLGVRGDGARRVAAALCYGFGAAVSLLLLVALIRL